MNVIFFILLWIVENFQNGMAFSPWFACVNITHPSPSALVGSVSLFDAPLIFCTSHSLITTGHWNSHLFSFLNREHILSLYHHRAQNTCLWIFLLNWLIKNSPKIILLFSQITGSDSIFSVKRKLLISK